MLEPVLLVLAGALIVFGGLCAMADAALSRVPRVHVEEFARERRRGAAALAHVISDAARYLNLVLLLRVAAEMTAAVIVTVAAVRIFGMRWPVVVLVSVAMVVVSYVVVGVAPRTLGRQHADAVSLVAAPVVSGLARFLGPIPKLLIAFGNAITPGRGFREGPFTTEAELRDLVDLAEKARVIESDERQMIHSVFEFGDTLVREVMVPRTDIVFIEKTKTLRQAMSLALRSGFSRIPVVGENEDDVVGIVYLRDLAKRIYEYREAESTERVESIMRPPIFVPDSKPIDELLREMQAGRNHVAIVVDEYGGTAGLVTIEDILEELVGEISDEHDVERPRVEELPDGTLRVTARLPVDELEELFSVRIERDGQVETVGGLLAQALGRVPIPGATARVAGLELVAEGAAGRRNKIATVLVRRVGDGVAVEMSDRPGEVSGPDAPAEGEAPGDPGGERGPATDAAAADVLQAPRGDGVRR
ncbi:MAG: HlyC/CorC family transporter [Acidothermus sp.]|nr:HlyC/CorC family transporter [Acidothermus sp.]MCL6538098.1 hemolysin family protein [Acidothermus sp.]